MNREDWFSNGIGMAALLCGGLALVLCFLPYVGFVAWVLAPLAIGLGIMGVQRPPRKAGSAAIALGVATLIASVVSVTLINRANEQSESAKDKASAGLDGTLTTMAKRDEGSTVNTPTAAPALDPVVTRGETPQGRTSAFAPPLPDAPPEAITLGEYNLITNGMSYEQVVGLVGSEGRIVNDLNSGTMSVRGYEWRGANPGATAKVQFQNGLSISKMQTGLE